MPEIFPLGSPQHRTLVWQVLLDLRLSTPIPFSNLMSAPVLELYELTKAYPSPKGPAVIVKDFNLNFAAGEFITLIGHSGCGKSTVLSMVAGLTDVTDGAMILAGKETVEAGPDRGVVFQSPSFSLG